MHVGESWPSYVQPNSLTSIKGPSGLQKSFKLLLELQASSFHSKQTGGTPRTTHREPCTSLVGRTCMECRVIL